MFAGLKRKEKREREKQGWESMRHGSEINAQVEGGASSRAESYGYLLKWDLEKAGSQVWGTIQ